ncbi:DUF5666 domain-containing protein [Tengunoibacter tsumagoiensis]|uniref:DUF5666 domain-containing protein n=1 Tax=Tengunoibacter tsumagoiensis TaxID=2014871 RepID=A0A402AA36_9CHLR|nr:DUF5666 domain-containing protein [Tengunoibacter tsumagoiensis]GCE16037.1 hypothetical protein KTT_58960 [Tengunoibacter tsumagoiensis]
MFSNRSHKFLATGVVSIAVLATLSGCGSVATQDSSSTGTATATCTPRNTTITRASGTVKSIGTDSLVITKQDGSNVTMTLSSQTVITQQTLAATSALTNGSFVTVAVTPSSDGSTYTADTILLTSGLGGGGFGRGTGGQNGGAGSGGQNGNNRNNSCRPQRAGTPGANGGFGGGRQNGGAGNGNGNRLFGTVAQVSGTTLVVDDASNNSYLLTLTSKTQIIQTQTVTASALQIGQNVSVVGTSTAATTITIVTNTPASAKNS